MSPRVYVKGTTSGATATIINLLGTPGPYFVGLVPGSGCTNTVEISADEVAASDPANAQWVAWSKGATNNAAAYDHILGPITAVRITRTVGSNDSVYVVRA
jgi:phosphoserine aminotransferase